MSALWQNPDNHQRCFGWHPDDGRTLNGKAVMADAGDRVLIHYIPMTRGTFDTLRDRLKGSKDLFLVGHVPSVMVAAEFDTLAHYQENIDYFKEQSILWGFKIHDFRDGV